MNHFYLIGKLIEQPEKRKSANGVKFIKFKIAVPRSLKEPQGETDLYEITGFNQLVDEDYETGKTMCFSGRVSANNFTSEETTHYNVRLVANSIATIA